MKNKKEPILLVNKIKKTYKKKNRDFKKNESKYSSLEKKYKKK